MTGAELNQSLAWAGSQFRQHARVFIGLAAIVSVLLLGQQIASSPLTDVLQGCLTATTDGQRLACQTALSGGVLPTLLVVLGFGLVAEFASIGVVRAALWTDLGRKPEFSALLVPVGAGRYFAVVLLQTVLTGIGLMLCILPGLFVMFLLQFARYAVIDLDCSVGQAIRVSARLAVRNPVPAVMTGLFVLLQILIGSTCFGIPNLLILPIASLFVARVYRGLQGRVTA